MHQNVDPFAFKTKESRNYFAIGLALLLVAILLGVLGSGILGFGRQVGGPVTKAATKSSAVLPASGNSGAILESGLQGGPVTQDPLTVKKMPQEIWDWLRHLERCEKRKIELCQKELTEAGVLRQQGQLSVRDGDFNDPEAAIDRIPGKPEGEAIEQFSDQWDKLITFFHSVPPPTKCIPTANAFTQHITEVKNYMVKVNEILQGIGNDLGDSAKLKAKLDDCRKLLDSNKSSIDVAGNETDSQVQQICDEYGVRKWFSIKGDVGEGIGPILQQLFGSK